MVTNDDVAENLPEGYTYDSEEYDEDADDGGEEDDSGDGEEEDEFPGIPKQEKVPKKNYWFYPTESDLDVHQPDLDEQSELRSRFYQQSQA